MVRLFSEKYFEILKLISECHIDAAALLIEKDAAVSEGEKGVVLAHADIGTGMPLGAALADEDVSCDDDFATVFLDAEALTI